MHRRLVWFVFNRRELSERGYDINIFFIFVVPRRCMAISALHRFYKEKKDRNIFIGADFCIRIR
jgi:hypothetical protein